MGTVERKPKASDIDDVEFLRSVHRISIDGRWPEVPVRWVSIWEMEPIYPELPPKVVAAKFRQLLKRGLLDGCPCGCRGDLELTADGMAFMVGR